MALYLFSNGATQTTAAPTIVGTGATIKTMLQVKPGTTQFLDIVEWGFSFDLPSANATGKIELIETDVAATVTAAAAADITKIDAEALSAGDPTTNIFAVGTTSTGYTSSGEGTTTASRNLDAPFIWAPQTNSGSNIWSKQFPLGQEPVIQPSKFMRIRVTFSSAVNMYCYVKVRS